MPFKYFILFVCLVTSSRLFSQGGYPWERPLRFATSTDGQNFSPSQIWQDSSGVPSVIRWKGDTLICAFQWFRQPNPSPTWDRVAVKFSYDNGTTWAQPIPIQIPNLPVGWQRPFDPTLAVADSGKIRIYFSSSYMMPPPGQDSIINTYSAISYNGINYTFEPNARFDDSTRKAIDPAVIKFRGMWHYAAPKGAPQDGAFHAIGPDGFNFNRVQDIFSDAQHNWTGNYMVNDTNELRFYGAGATIWYNTSPNGGQWNGYVNTNISGGGDPSVVKLGTGSYMIIYVGPPYPTVSKDTQLNGSSLIAFPNPVKEFLQIKLPENSPELSSINISDILGKTILVASVEYHSSNTISVDMKNLETGIYFVELKIGNDVERIRFVKE